MGQRIGIDASIPFAVVISLHIYNSSMCTANNCTSKRCPFHKIIHATTDAHLWPAFTCIQYTSFLPPNISDRIDNLVDVFFLLITHQSSEPNILHFILKKSHSQVITFQMKHFHIILISSNLKQKIVFQERFRELISNKYRKTCAKTFD